MKHIVTLGLCCQLVGLIQPLFGQNLDTEAKLLMKYWRYRHRLIGDEEVLQTEPGFLKTGKNEAGYVIPAKARMPWITGEYWGLGEHYCNYQGDRSSLGVIRFNEDPTIDLGNYIAVLATEWKLLSDAGQSTSQTEYELYYALKAIDRLDLYGEVFYDKSADLNGFFVRDDVPGDFHQHFGPNYNYAVSTNCLGLLPDNDDPKLVTDIIDPSTGQKIGDNYTDDNGKMDACEAPREYGSGAPEDFYVNSESQDQLYGLLFGLAFVHKYIPSSVTYNGEGLKSIGSSQVDRLISHVKYGLNIPQSVVVDFVTNSLSELGVTEDYGFYDLLGWTIRDPNYERVCRGPYAQPYAFPLSVFAYNVTNDPKFLSDPFAFSTSGGILAWGFTQASMLIPQNEWNITFGLKVAAISGTMIPSEFYLISKQWKKELYELSVAALHDYTPLTNREDFEADLLTAPCDGPCNDYSSLNYISPTNNCPNTPGWRTPKVWDSMDERNGFVIEDGKEVGKITGEFNGLDYMLAYNIYRLAYSGHNVSYSQQINRVTTNTFPNPVFTTIGTDTYPVVTSAVSTYTVKSIINSDGNVKFTAAKEVVAEDGFTAEYGSEVELSIEKYDCTPTYYSDISGGQVAYLREGQNSNGKTSYDYSQAPYLQNFPGGYTNIDYTGKQTSSIETEEKDFGRKGTVLLYPNPNTGQFTITSFGSRVETVEITNLLGESILRTGELYNNSNTIDLSSYGKGVYLARIKTPEGWQTKKIVYN